jgi:hypothetical protein
VAHSPPGWGQEALDLPAAGQPDELHVAAIGGNERGHPWAHPAPITEDVGDEGERDPVVHAVGVLAAAVAPAPSGDAPQAGQGRQVQKDHRVGASESDRQSGRVVAFDQPPLPGDQFALGGREFLGRCGLPPVVVVQLVEVDHVQTEADAEASGEDGLAGAAAADNDDPVHGQRPYPSEGPGWVQASRRHRDCFDGSVVIEQVDRDT